MSGLWLRMFTAYACLEGQGEELRSHLRAQVLMEDVGTVHPRTTALTHRGAWTTA